MLVEHMGRGIGLGTYSLVYLEGYLILFEHATQPQTCNEWGPLQCMYALVSVTHSHAHGLNFQLIDMEGW